MKYKWLIFGELGTQISCAIRVSPPVELPFNPYGKK